MEQDFLHQLLLELLTSVILKDFFKLDVDMVIWLNYLKKLKTIYWCKLWNYGPICYWYG